jgi:hypothetical protein
VSLYADDAVVFLKPEVAELKVAETILTCFEGASGLATNLAKCSITPIRCSEEQVERAISQFRCKLAKFPCKYLGIPLAIKKLTKAQEQPFVDKVADRLPTWKAKLLTRTGRLVLTKVTLTSLVIYPALALELSPWAIRSIDKLRRASLWRGSEVVSGGHCLVAWKTVCRPEKLGGLGIIDLHSMGLALQLRWIWLHRVEPDKPGSKLPHPTSKSFRILEAMFEASISVELNDGRSILFWRDKWVQGQSLELIVPNLVQTIPRRILNSRTVFEALNGRRWVRDIISGLSVQAIVEYLKVWNLLSNYRLNEQPYLFCWKWEWLRSVLHGLSLQGVLHRAHRTIGSQANLENQNTE